MFKEVWNKLSPQDKLASVKTEGCYRCGSTIFNESANKLVCSCCDYNYWIEPDKSDGLYRSYTISEESILGKQGDASKWNDEISKGFLD